MLIAIDISQIVHGTGVSYYTSSLVKNLAKIDKKNDYLLFGYSLRQRQTLLDFAGKIKKFNPRFRAKIFPLPPTLVEYIGNNLRFFNLEKLIGSVDIYHSSDWVQFSTRAKCVTTIHDFGFFKFPQTAQPKILSVMKKRFKLVEKEADRVIAVSQATAKDTIEYLDIPKDKIEVIYEAAPEEFEKSSGTKVEQVKEKFDIEGKYFLLVATLEPRKNLARIIKAFVRFCQKNPGYFLVVVGKAGWDKSILALKRKLPNVIFTGYVSNRELSALYTGAQALVYASLYEGFGQPILEAFACDCPVVTSGVSSMPEVAGNAAILVDPKSVKSITQGMFQVLKNKKKLKKRGRRRLKQFSWEKTAQKTLEVYRKVGK